MAPKKYRNSPKIFWNCFWLFSSNYSAVFSRSSSSDLFSYIGWVQEYGECCVSLGFACWNDGVLRINILELITGPWLFHSPNGMIFQCTVLPPNMWLLSNYLPVLLWGVGHVLFLDIYTKIIDNQGEIYWATFVCP